MLKNQQGAVLIVSLIMLLLLTILAVSSMSTTIMEEKVTGNFKDKNTAFQSAEAALRDGEIYMRETANLPTFNGTTAGLYEPTTTGSSRWQIVDWRDATKVRAYTGLNGVAEQPKYIIEELIDVIENDGSLGIEAEQFTYYRITARAVGGTNTAVVMLQTIFKRKSG